MIKAPAHLAREFQMRQLILPHRYAIGFIDQDICGLKKRITQKPVGRKVAVRHFLLLLFVGRHALKPR